MFWPFVEIDGELTYCPLAGFGTQNLREGRDIYGKAVVAQPLTGHFPLHNAAHASGKIVVVERGRCDFVTKVLHAQAAGAIAVLVANASRENPDEAFVMDAGRRSEEEVSSIRIPAMMISYNKAVTLFEQLRECFLDRRELSMTIKFLGAQTSAHVLEQIENAARQREHEAQESSLQYERAQQQRKAAEILRKRLGKPVEEEPAAVAVEVPILSPLATSSPARSASTSSASTPSKMSASTPTRITSSRPRKRSISSEPPHELPLFLGDSMDTLSVASSVGSRSAPRFPAPSETIAMHAWCPMTTALLVVDVQNYFALEQNEASVPLLHAAGRAREFYKRVHSVVVPRLQDVLLACRACEGTEVLYTVVESVTHDGRERSRAHKHAGLHVPRGGFGAQVLARVAPGDDDMVLPRTGANVFEATNVDYVLRNLGASHLVVAGLSVLRAVPLLALTALDRGYQVTLLRDALASSDGDEALDEALRRCERQGAQVLTAGAFVAELRSYDAESNNDM